MSQDSAEELVLKIEGLWSGDDKKLGKALASFSTDNRRQGGSFTIAPAPPVNGAARTRWDIFWVPFDSERLLPNGELNPNGENTHAMIRALDAPAGLFVDVRCRGWRRKQLEIYIRRLVAHLERLGFETQRNEVAFSRIASQWIEKEEWSIEEALCLLYDFDPDAVPEPLPCWLARKNNPFRDITLAEATRSILETMREALSDRMAPIAFLQHAQAKLPGGLQTQEFKDALWRAGGKQHPYLHDYLIVDKPLGTGPSGGGPNSIWLLFTGDASQVPRIFKMPDKPFEISTPDWDEWTIRRPLWRVSEAARLVFDLAPYGLTTPLNIGRPVTIVDIEGPLWPPEAVDLELLARNAIEADELKPAPSDNELVPRKRFIRWVWDMRYNNLPEPMLRLIGKDTSAEADLGIPDDDVDDGCNNVDVAEGIVWEVLTHKHTDDWEEMTEAQYRNFIRKEDPVLWIEERKVKRCPAGTMFTLSKERLSILIAFVEKVGRSLHPHEARPSECNAQSKSSITLYNRLRTQLDPKGVYLKIPDSGLHEGWGFFPEGRTYCISCKLD